MVKQGTYKHRIGLDRAQLPDRTRFSVLWSFFLRYFILYAQLEEVYSIQNYFYLTPSFQYKNKNSAEGVIAPAGAKVTGATIRMWLLNKFISFLAVLTWKTGLKKM